MKSARKRASMHKNCIHMRDFLHALCIQLIVTDLIMRVCTLSAEWFICTMYIHVGGVLAHYCLHSRALCGYNLAVNICSMC